MADDSQKQNLSAAYELLKQWTDIADIDAFEELGPATVFKTPSMRDTALTPSMRDTAFVRVGSCNRNLDFLSWIFYSLSLALSTE